jgi:hypothetical protein
MDQLAAMLPHLRERFASYQSFSEAAVENVIAPWRKQAAMLECRTLASALFLNRESHFEAHELPREAQFAPAFGACVADFDGDGHEDLFVAQNFFAVPFQTHPFDAGRGLLLRGLGDGDLRSVPGRESGIDLTGEQRGAAVADFDEDGRIDLAVAQNGGALNLFHNRTAQPGLRVRLKGPTGNPNGVGAVLRLEFADRVGPARELHAGSGYLSQDSLVMVLATPQPPKSISVRWPGGRTVSTPLPAGARTISIDTSGQATLAK